MTAPSKFESAKPASPSVNSSMLKSGRRSGGCSTVVYQDLLRKARELPRDPRKEATYEVSEPPSVHDRYRLQGALRLPVGEVLRMRTKRNEDWSQAAIYGATAVMTVQQENESRTGKQNDVCR